MSPNSSAVPQKEKEKLCLICLSSTKGDNNSVVTRIFEEEDAVWNKLCSYWLIPPRNFKKTLDVCGDHHLCKGCARTMKEVIKIQSQVESLELWIKKKAHEMAKMISESTKVLKDSPTKKLKAEEVWLKFKDPVIESKKD